MLAALRQAGFDVETRNHAAAILDRRFRRAARRAWSRRCSAFRIGARELIQSGGGHAETTMRLRDALAGAGWRKHVFAVQDRGRWRPARGGEP